MIRNYLKQNHLKPKLIYCIPETNSNTNPNNNTNVKEYKTTKNEFLKSLIFTKEEDLQIDLSNISLRTAKEKEKEKKKKLQIKQLTYNDKIRLNDRIINKAYPHLLSFNIPKSESELNLTRGEMYYFFTQFKSIINFWINMNAYGTTSIRGIDFEPFINFVPNVCNEIPVLAYEIFYHIDKSQDGSITLVDNLKGMAYRAKHKDKEIDLFLKLLNPNKSKAFDYEQIKEICKLSIRNHMLKKANRVNSYLEDLLSNEISEALFEYAKTPFDGVIPFSTIKSIVKSQLKGYKHLSFFSFSS